MGVIHVDADDKSKASLDAPPSRQLSHEDVVEPPVADTETGKTTLPPKPTRLKRVLSFLDDQWFLIAMGIVIAIASQVQVAPSQQHVKEVVVSYLAVSIIFLITGCTLDTKILFQNYGRWKVHIWVQVQCFLLSSALVFGIVSATATNKDFMDPGLLVGLIFCSCVATTISSNVIMTGQAHGNRALTVVETTIGNFIGVFISPALIVMYTSVPTWYNAVLPPESGDFAAIYRRVLMQLGLSIYLPMAVGQVFRYFCPNVCTMLFARWKLNKISMFCMLLIIWQTFDQAFASQAFTSVPGSNMIFIVFISITIWLLLFAVSFFTSLLWLDRKDVVSVIYVVPAKSTALGVPLSTTVFAGISLQLQSKIQIPIVIYQGLQIAFGSILIVVFRRWVDSEQRKSRTNDVEQGPGEETPVAEDSNLDDVKSAQ